MSYYDIWHMTYAQQNMALWVSKDPSQSVEWIYKLIFICYQYSFWYKMQKSDFGHFSLYFEGNSFVKYKCDLAKANRSKKLGNIFFYARCGIYYTEKLSPSCLSNFLKVHYALMCSLESTMPETKYAYGSQENLQVS